MRDTVYYYYIKCHLKMFTYDARIGQHPLDTQLKRVSASLDYSFLFLSAPVFLRFHCNIVSWPKINATIVFLLINFLLIRIMRRVIYRSIGGELN